MEIVIYWLFVIFQTVDLAIVYGVSRKTSSKRFVNIMIEIRLHKSAFRSVNSQIPFHREVSCSTRLSQLNSVWLPKSCSDLFYLFVCSFLFVFFSLYGNRDPQSFRNCSNGLDHASGSQRSCVRSLVKRRRRNGRGLRYDSRSVATKFRFDP